MGQVGDLIGAQGAAAAGVLGPAEHPGLEEGAIDDQLGAALEQVEQANLALGSLEFIRLLDGHPRHPPAFGGQRVTGAHRGLLLHQQLLARSRPLLWRHDRRCIHRARSALPVVPGGYRHNDLLFVGVLFNTRQDRNSAQRLSYSSWRRNQGPVSLRPLGARSSQWYTPKNRSTP